MTTIINEVDFIPRAQTKSAFEYRQYYLSVLSNAKISKWDI